MENFPKKMFNVSSTNSTSKTVMSGEDMLTLNSETEKNAKIASDTLNKLVHDFNFDTKKIMRFINSKGTPVIMLDNAKQKIQKRGFEIGFVPDTFGFGALALNIMAGTPLQFQSPAMIVLDKKKVGLDVALVSFYKWYTYYMDMPGLDENAQRLLRKASNGKLNMKSLKLDDMTALKEALTRDKEATNFALSIVREVEASKKMKDSGTTKM